MQEISNDGTVKPPKKPKPILALSLSLLAIAAGSYVFVKEQSLNLALSDLRTTVQKQETQIKQLNTQQEAFAQNLKNNTAALENSHNQLQQTLAQLGQNTANWSVEEAIYLVRLANINLYVQYHLPVAIKLLQAAEQQLQGSSEPKILPIRQALVNNITALQSIPQVNIETAIMQLQALLPQLNSLTLKIKNNFVIAENEAKEVSHKEFKYPWMNNLYKVGENLRQLIIIRRHDDIVKSLPSEKQLAYIVQNMGILLQEAQWALLQGDQKLFDSSLNQTKQWLDDYFDTQSSVGQNFLQALNQLSQLKLRPALPELTNLLPELEALRKA